MNIKISDKLFKKFNNVDKEKIKNKILQFAEQLLNERINFKELPKGYWVRPIITCPGRYKFRVNIKDRIIFEYGSNKQTLHFLDYVSHDKQIIAAQRMQSLVIENLEINKSEYVEDDFDYELDKMVRAEAYALFASGNLDLALSKYESIGAKNKTKLLKFAISVEEAQADYNMSHFMFGIKTKRPINKSDIIYIFNYFHSEYSIVPGRYIYITYRSFNKDIYVSETFKNLGDYFSHLAQLIFNEVNCENAKYVSFCISFYNKNGELIKVGLEKNEHFVYPLIFELNLIEKPKVLHKDLSFKAFRCHPNLRIKNQTPLEKTVNQKSTASSLARKNLEYLGI